MKDYTEIILGTTVKLNVHIHPIGNLHMENYDFTCYVYTPEGNTVTITKKDAVRVDEDNYIIAVDSLRIGTGRLYNRVIADLPDRDCPNGKRREIEVFDCKIKIICPNGVSRW